MAAKKAAWATTAEEESINDHRLQWVKNQMIAGAIPGDLTDGRQAEVAARNRLSGCLWWIDATSGSGKFNLNDLISNGTTLRERLQASKECLSLEPSWTDIQGRVVEDYSRKYDEWLGRWQRARAEAEAVGLDGTITYYYWEENIQVPDEVTRACKWFDTVERMIKTTDMDAARLGKFADDAIEHIQAMHACQESWPRARRTSIERHYTKSYALMEQWHVLAARSAVDLCRSLAQGDRAQGLAREAQYRLDTAVTKAEKAAVVLREYRAARRKLREKQLRKRTCWVCAKTAPLSSHAFAYCGGCRHASIPRVDRPRYCSEACQRAHWLAGHMHECPREE